MIALLLAIVLILTLINSLECIKLSCDCKKLIWRIVGVLSFVLGVVLINTCYKKRKISKTYDEIARSGYCNLDNPEILGHVLHTAAQDRDNSDNNDIKEKKGIRCVKAILDAKDKDGNPLLTSKILDTSSEHIHSILTAIKNNNFATGFLLLNDDRIQKRLNQENIDEITNTLNKKQFKSEKIDILKGIVNSLDRNLNE